MAEFQRALYKFVMRGLNLNLPPGQMPEGKYPFLQNIRSFQDGRVESRPGFEIIAGGFGSAIHTIKRLNNALPDAVQDFARLIGAGTSLFSDDSSHTIFTSLTSSLSGNPLSICTIRPEQSPEAWGYIADSNLMLKARTDGTLYNMGIAAPINVPVVNLAPPIYKTIDNFDDATLWHEGGTAAAPTLESRINTTISKIVFDSGSTGWATVSPAFLDENLQPQMTLVVNIGGGTQEEILVESIGKSSTATTIASIVYDSGTTGRCTVSLTSWSGTLRAYDLLHLNSGGGTDEVVTVRNVVYGPTGLPSFQCSTANNHLALEPVSTLSSFRANFTNTHVIGETLKSSFVQSIISTGTGYIDRTITIDLSSVSNRPIRPSDIIHVSIKMDTVGFLTEGKILFDLDAVTNDFSQNALFKDFRANDLTPAIAGTATSLQTRQKIIQRFAIDTYKAQRLGQSPTNRPVQNPFIDAVFGDPDPFDLSIGDLNQTGTGDNQWTEFSFRVSDLTKIGTDSSRSLRDVAKIRIQLQVTGATTVGVDSLWIGGTSGLDSSLGDNPFPYFYSYRAKNEATGDSSNPSPPTRNGQASVRRRLQIALTQHTDPQVDILQVYRFGGTNNEWHYVGEVDNGVNPIFYDDLGDEAIINQPLLEFDNFQPFPDLDSPKSGICTTTGTKIIRTSGDPFNTNWAAGSEIIIGGIAYTLYNNPSDTNTLEVTESAGYQTNAGFKIPQATLTNQPLPAMFGPYGGGQFGLFLFACGSNYQPGSLFWTKPNQPGTSKDKILEISSPSEPLINGCMYDGRPYVFSSERFYMIQGPSVDANGEITFLAQEVANSIGLHARYGLCVGDLIYFIAKDGIYKSEGGQVACITDTDLYSLFPTDGINGESINGVIAPDFTQINNLRLCYSSGYIYFDYKGIDGLFHTLIYDTRIDSWLYDKYTPTISTRYLEEGEGLNSLLLGSSNGKLFLTNGPSDGGKAIDAIIQTPSIDVGDARIDKHWGDLWLETNCQGVTVNITPGQDEHTFLYPSSSFIGSGITYPVIELNNGAGIESTDISFSFNWSSLDTTPFLYWWSPSFVPKTEISNMRATDWDMAGYSGLKFVQGTIIEADTFGVDKLVRVQYDEGQLGPILTINHNGQASKQYPQTKSPSWIPFLAHNVRLFPIDNTPWKCYNVRWVWEPAPELATHWETQPTTHDLQGYQLLAPYCYIALASTQDVTLTILADNVSNSYTINGTSGLYQKIKVPLKITKGRNFTYTLNSSEGFQLYQKDCEVRVKSWGSSEGFIVKNPFGSLSREHGADI